MALVPYRVSGPAADQRATERLLQFPRGVVVRLTQWPGLSGAQAHQAAEPAATASAAGAGAGTPKGASAHSPPLPLAVPQQQAAQSMGGPPLSSLANVGLVVWQAGFLLGDFLLRRAPLVGSDPGCWRSLTAVDLGTGSGVVGIALALAGARVFLTDLPHVLPLAAANVAANCDPRRHRTIVCPYTWGDDPAAPAAPVVVARQAGPAASAGDVIDSGGLGVQGGGDGSGASPLAGLQPDLITAADVLYHRDLLEPLMRAIRVLSAPHTVTYVSYRVRQGGEVASFLALVEAAGFAASEVPDAELHEEYRAGGAGHSAGPAAGAVGAAVAGGAPGGELLDGGRAAMDVDDEGGSDSGLCDDGGGGPGVARTDWLAVERGGAAQQWRVGSYGILRLSRRDTPLVAAAPGSTAAMA